MAEVMKYADVQKLDAKSVDAKVVELRREYFNLKMQRTTSGIENPQALKTIKKNIARLMTAKNNKNS